MIFNLAASVKINGKITLRVVATATIGPLLSVILLEFNHFARLALLTRFVNLNYISYASSFKKIRLHALPSFILKLYHKRIL